MNVLNTLKTQFFKLKEDNELLTLKTLELIANSPTTTMKGIEIGLLNIEIDYKLLSKAFKNFPPNYLLMIKSDKNKIQILSNNEVFKANDIINELIKRFGGKGGGNPRSAQATLKNEPTDIISDIKK